MSERRSLLDEVPLAETLGTTGVSPQVSILWGLSNTSDKDRGGSRCCIAQVGATRHWVQKAGNFKHLFSLLIF
jgi:hypothetical protein